ncbi:hypothetical protein D3C71_154400 [compost metagenome]
MSDLRASSAYILNEVLIPILVMAVILVGVGIVVRAVMGKRFGNPEVPSGSLWWSFERIVMRKVEHDQARSSGLEPTEKTLDRD